MNVRTFCGTPCSYPAGTSSARDLQRLHAQRCLSSIGGRTELRRQLYGQSFHQWELLRIRGVRSYGVGPKQSFVYVGSSHMRSDIPGRAFPVPIPLSGIWIDHLRLVPTSRAVGLTDGCMFPWTKCTTIQWNVHSLSSATTASSTAPL